MIPNFVFENIIKNDESNKKLYIKNILEGETHRKDREVFRVLRKKGLLPVVQPSHIEHILNYDNQNSWDYLKNKLTEEFKENHINEPKKYPNHILTKYTDGIYDTLHDYFNRESYDNNNGIVNIFHTFGRGYNNAFFSGSELAFGEGDGIYFKTFILADIVGHEYAHWLQAYETDFIYQGQSGALNEHIADVFGITFDQIVKGVDVNSSKWLIGEGIWTDRVNGVALRSMKNPGTAYDDNIVGKDPQVPHFSQYYETDEDDGGVHIFSSFGNRAFYLANIKKGGKIHENGIGNIWYNTILKKNGLPSNTQYNQFAQATIDNAQEFHDKEIIHDSWKEVGIETSLPNNPIDPPTDPDKFDCPILNLVYKVNSALFRH